MTDTDIVTRIEQSKDWNRLIGLLHAFAAQPNDSGGQIEARNKVTDLVKELMARCAREAAEECAKVCDAEASGPPTAGFVYADGFIDGASKCGDAIRAKFKA